MELACAHSRPMVANRQRALAITQMDEQCYGVAGAGQRLLLRVGGQLAGARDQSAAGFTESAHNARRCVSLARFTSAASRNHCQHVLIYLHLRHPTV